MTFFTSIFNVVFLHIYRRRNQDIRNEHHPFSQHIEQTSGSKQLYFISGDDYYNNRWDFLHSVKLYSIKAQTKDNEVLNSYLVTCT